MDNKVALNVGYYASLSIQSKQFVGGLLVVNSNGRPLEFHCTSPVKPNRPQQVLFGNSLESFVIGESILPKLASECKSKVDLICIEDPIAISGWMAP